MINNKQAKSTWRCIRLAKGLPVVRLWAFYKQQNSIKPRDVLLVTGYALNVVLALLHIFNVFAFGSFVLYICAANLSVYLITYTCGKVAGCCCAVKSDPGSRSKKQIGILAYCLFVAVGSWIWATVYFMNPNADSDKTAAQSRDLNKECMVGFYDGHDIWHMLSAVALFHSLMVIFLIDDDVVNEERNNIPVLF